jgi:hypothetical protein
MAADWADSRGIERSVLSIFVHIANSNSSTFCERVDAKAAANSSEVKSKSGSQLARLKEEELGEKN